MNATDRIEFNDTRLQAETLQTDILQCVKNVLVRGRYIMGSELEAFEREFAAYCGTTYAVGVASGTDALMLSLRAAGVGPGDEVLVPALSASATAIAVVALEARPVFVDISPSDLMMDASIARQRRTSRTRAVVPVHLYGMPARLPLLDELGVPVIEDASQAHGSEGDWGRCGSRGLAAAFSFYPTKNLGGYGDGGMVVTSDKALAGQLRLLRNYGERQRYVSDIVGMNSRLDELQAAILRLKLKRLDDWNRRRGEIARQYAAGLEGLPVKLQLATGRSNYHLFTITTSRRTELRHWLEARQVPTLIHYPVALPRHPAFARFSPDACPHADEVCASILSLPIHAYMPDTQVDRIISAIREFFS